MQTFVRIRVNGALDYVTKLSMTNYSLVPRVSLISTHVAQRMKSMPQNMPTLVQCSCITHDGSTTYYEVLPVLIVVTCEVQTLRNL